LDRGPAHGETFDGRELLGEVVVVEARIPPPGEGEDLGPEGLREPMGRPAPAVAVDQGGRPRPEPAHLPGRESQRFRRLGYGDLVPLEPGEHVKSPPFFLSQCHLSSSL
jgi:hypothetical protein